MVETMSSLLGIVSYMTFILSMTFTMEQSYMSSLLDRKNWSEDENWYRVDDQIAWWDWRIKAWTTYMVTDDGHQNSDAQYYANKTQFLKCEKLNRIRVDVWDN